MTTKEWLSRAWDIDNEIKLLIDEQKTALNRATGSNFSKNKEKVQTSRKNISESKFTNYVSYSELIDSLVDELYTVKREIVLAIWNVKDRTLRMLLFARYVQFKTWEQVAEIIHKQDVKWVRTAIHSRALKNISSFLQNDIDSNN